MTEIILDELRLADAALQDEKKLSFFIERQFPAIYRENGRELVELVKAYYRFLEENESQSIYNIRRIYEYRNIDTTLDNMLLFFKNKFLNGLFFEEDTKFIIKNILDLYRRKGSKEGIELFFKLFFDSEVEIYFPSQDIFKPSSSIWKSGSFIQLYSTSDLSIFSDIVNKKIFGDKSNAGAFVDNVYFMRVRGAYVPIIFISDIKGEFIRFDTIYSLEPTRKSYGRIYGSMRSVEVSQSGPGGNAVGDIVDIVSTAGSGGKGRVSKVSQNLSGQIQFVVEDGNYGYTDSNTDIIISNQNAFFGDQDGAEFIINERVKQVKNSNVEVFGTVIGKKSDSIGIFVDEPQDETYFFQDGIPIETVSRESNISKLPLFITTKNSTATAELGTLKNTETVVVITDLLENYLDVPLNSSNYSEIPPALFEMSGTRVNSVIPDANTPLNEAFVPETFVLGEIDTLTNVDPGFNHVSDVFVLARENIIRRFNLSDQILNISIPNGVILLEGDFITQQKQVKTFEGNNIITTVKGVIVKSEGNNKTIKQLTFESFVVDEPIFKVGSNIPITVNSRSRDFSSSPLGLNAVIKGDVETVTGKIQEIEIIDSGVGYEDGSLVEIVNTKRKEVKKINFFAAFQGILRAATGIQPDLDLFGVIMPETNNPLGDINQNGDITSQDALEMARFANGNLEDQNMINYINNIFVPFLLNNQTDYANYIETDFETDIIITEGTALTKRQGITEGRWRNFVSHTNQEKVIQDSFFYQDYSYEITTDMESSVYENEYVNIMHPAGIKLFTGFNNINNINIDVNVLRPQIDIVSAITADITLITADRTDPITADLDD